MTENKWYVTAIMNGKKLYLDHKYNEFANSILNLGWYWYDDPAEGTVYDTLTKATELVDILKIGRKFPGLTDFKVEGYMSN